MFSVLQTRVLMCREVSYISRVICDSEGWYVSRLVASGDLLNWLGEQPVWGLGGRVSSLHLREARPSSVEHRHGVWGVKFTTTYC